MTDGERKEIVAELTRFVDEVEAQSRDRFIDALIPLGRVKTGKAKDTLLSEDIYDFEESCCRRNILVARFLIDYVRKGAIDVKLTVVKQITKVARIGSHDYAPMLAILARAISSVDVKALELLRAKMNNRVEKRRRKAQ